MTQPPRPDAPHDAYDPLTPVPASSRSFVMRDAFALWFSLGIGLLVLQAGAVLVPGLSLTQAILAIVIGSVTGAVLLALAGVVGSDSGLATIAALRPTLGIRGASVPAVLNIVQLAGWGAFEIIAMRDAADALSDKAFGHTFPILWTVGFGLLATLLAVMGPLNVVRRFLRHWGIWILLLGAAWMTWALLARQDLAALFARAGDGSLSLGAGIDIVAAMPLSWLPLIADYSRFGTSSKAMFRGSALGYVLANIWFYALGAAYALVASSDPNAMLLSALATTGGGLALLLVLIDETDNVFADIFSAAMSSGALFARRLGRLRVSHLAFGFGLLCTLIALVVPMTQFTTFLYMIGSIFTPLYGVLLVDHFVIRQRRVVAEDIDRDDGIYRFSFGVHITAFAAWLTGIATYYAIASFAPMVGATLPALAVAGVVYFGLALITRD